jgi:hypothetical protein
MAPAGIQALLALKISDQKSGLTRNRRRGSRTHSPHVARESDLGAPRIQSELTLLGYVVAERTVAKYMVRTRKPPSQSLPISLQHPRSPIAIP